MQDMISMVLGTAGWFAGLMVLVVMAALPLLESIGGRR
jgi:hypothetical protein